MSNFLRRVRAFLRRDQLAADLAEELETHRLMLAERMRRDGVGSREADAASRRAMGNATLSREDARAAWLAPWLESVLQDLRYGVRHLIAHPAFSITTAATLLLAIVLNTSFFTLFNTTVLRAWPVPDAGRIAIVQSRSADPAGAAGVLMSDFEFLRTQTRTFASLFAIRGGGSRVSTTSAPSDEFVFVQSAYVSGNFFTDVRVPMAIGRGFVHDEDLADRPASVGIISAGLWQRAFGEDRSVLGRTIYVNRQPVTIVGVTAASVNGMWPFVNELWMPMAAMALHRRAGGDCCATTVAGRLADGVSREAARTELSVLMAQLDAAAQRKSRIVTLYGTRPLEQPGGAGRFAPYALVLGGLLAILLLACSNIGNLQLARAFARQREFATRLAIGASRPRIVRQLLTETLFVTAVVSTAALALSYVLPETILRATGTLPPMRVAPDMTVAAFSLFLCVVATIVTGLVPALRGTRDAADFSAARRGSFGTRRAVLRTVLLGVQVTLSATLLFGAALLTRGLLHAWNIDPGYSLRTVSVVKVTLPPQAYDAARAAAFRTQLRDAFAAANLGPVGMADTVPLEPSRLVAPSVRRPQDAPADARTIHLRSYSAELFTLLNIPVVAGRLFDERQAGEVMINESMARAFWPGSSAVGQQLIDGSRTREVVGVVRDAQMTDLGPVEPAIFIPRIISPMPAFLLRSEVKPAQIRGIVGQLDPRATVTVAPLAETLRQALTASYTGVTISWMLGAVALVLAVGGVFGVFSYLVEERAREIAIRVALGARRAQVVAALFGSTRTALVAGLSLAAVLSFAAGQALRSFLYGLSPFDPVAYLGTAALLALAAIAATIIPARRAMTVDPVVALRSE